jgi:large subunit ribosomal protein L9
MEVILIDDVFELGKRGTVVRVADGYGRNYLIPKSLAIPATPGNRKMIEQQRLAMAKKESKYQEEAELLTSLGIGAAQGYLFGRPSEVA